LIGANGAKRIFVKAMLIKVIEQTLYYDAYIFECKKYAILLFASNDAIQVRVAKDASRFY
jgi:hypothetical protein